MLEHAKSLDEVVHNTELRLSASQEFVVMNVAMGGEKGPDGETQYFANSSIRESWWVPTSMTLSTIVHKRPGDKVPFVYDEKANKSHFCLALQQDLMEKAKGAVSSRDVVPLPGSSPSTASAPAAPTIGSVSLPGLTRNQASD